MEFKNGNYSREQVLQIQLLNHLDFHLEVMDGLLEFLQSSETSLIIIAHGGYLHDFPILLAILLAILIANCMQHKYDWTSLEGCMFLNSMQVLQNSGYKRPGLNAVFLCSCTRRY